jgi:predicted transcriptional regulator of viral defense system
MPIMNQSKKLSKISNLSYFDTNTLSLIYPELSRNSLYANIKRWIKQRYLIQIKKGMYVTKEYVLNVQDKSSYKEFLANKIKYPSYLSMEYVLQKQSILSDAVYAYTSVTLKSKNTYTNEFGRYIYRNITRKLFTGYEIRDVGEYSVYEATKAKALFDYLYLKLYRVRNITKEVLLDLRLNLEEVDKDDMKEFEEYCELTRTEKYKKLSCLLKKAYDI